MTASTKPTRTNNQAASDRSIKRIKQLLPEGMSYKEMADVLNSEGYRTIRNLPWTALNLRQVCFKLRHEEPTWYGLSARRANLRINEVAA
jgi:hypothetical protein